MSRIFLVKTHPETPPRYRARKQTALYEAREASKTRDVSVEVHEAGVRDDLSRAQVIEECLNGGNWGTGSTALIAAFSKGKQIKLEPAA